MAIVEDDIVDEPAPLGRPVFYTVSSDDVNIVRVKASLDLFPDAEIILDPEIGDTNTFDFDFQKIIERNLGGYMTTEEGGHGLPTLDTFSIFDANESFACVTPTFIELVSTAAGGLIEGVTFIGTERAVVNAFLPREQSQNLNSFNLAVQSRRFLTNNSPNSPFPVTSRKIRLTDNSWLSTYTTNSASNILLEIAVTDTLNVVTTSFLAITDIQTHDRGDIPVGPAQINAGSLAGGSGGVQPIIDSTTKSYTVTVVSKGTEQVTNGDFTSGVGWAQTGSSWVIGAGVAAFNTPPNLDTLFRTLSLSTSTTYYTSTDMVSHGAITADLTVNHNNAQILFIDGVAEGNITKYGQFTTASSITNADIELDGVVSSIMSIDNVSIMQRIQLSETITFKLEAPCLEKEVMFYWENRLGGLDNYTFQSEQRGIVVDKKTYTKPLTKNFTTESRGRTTLGGESNNQFSAFSRPLKDNELVWLEELFEDRISYILVDGDFIPITVTRNSTQTVQEGLLQLRVDYTYANNKIILGK